MKPRCFALSSMPRIFASKRSMSWKFRAFTLGADSAGIGRIGMSGCAAFAAFAVLAAVAAVAAVAALATFAGLLAFVDSLLGSASEEAVLELLLSELLSDSESPAVSPCVDRSRFFALKKASRRSLVFEGNDEIASERFSSVSCNKRAHSFAAKACSTTLASVALSF